MFFVIFPSFWDLTLDWVENLLTLLLSFSIPGFIFARVQYTREQFSSTQFLDINCHYPAGLGLYKRLGWTSGPRKYMVAKNAKLQPIWFSAPVSWYLEITLFYMGFWKYVIILGEGSKRSPPPAPTPIKIHQNDLNLVKWHVLAKIDYHCPFFMHLDLNYYNFWPQKGPKNRCIFKRTEGSPFGLYMHPSSNLDLIHH